jgi:hypothetical protein
MYSDSFLRGKSNIPLKGIFPPVLDAETKAAPKYFALSSFYIFYANLGAKSFLPPNRQAQLFDDGLVRGKPKMARLQSALLILRENRGK